MGVLTIIKIIKNNREDAQRFFDDIRTRSESVDAQVSKVVAEIIADVRSGGDEAVVKYTKKFDCENPLEYSLDREQLKRYVDIVDSDYIDAITRAKENIIQYHENQKRRGYSLVRENGAMLGQIVRGLERVGLYVPGGTAAYPSTVLMNAVPAKIAGVEELIMVTPPQKDGSPNADIMAAAYLSGVDKVFLMGGIQAVAAMAYGTKIVPKVDKIVGPGNIYVATAKKQVYGEVDIDMIAGPSEILIIADEFANPKYLAADLMSQAEHDVLASSILLTTSESLALRVTQELEHQCKTLSRKDIIEKSLADYGAIILCPDIDTAIDYSNKIAPEHLEIMTKDAVSHLGKIKNAGSIFLGEYTPEPLGDYYSGTNHVLPTSGTARFFSPLGVDDFVKTMSYSCYTKQALLESYKSVITIADKEALSAHANSVKVRFE